jgi:hypothetical protein
MLSVQSIAGQAFSNVCVHLTASILVLTCEEYTDEATCIEQGACRCGWCMERKLDTSLVGKCIDTYSDCSPDLDCVYGLRFCESWANKCMSSHCEGASPFGYTSCVVDVLLGNVAYGVFFTASAITIAILAAIITLLILLKRKDTSIAERVQTDKQLKKQM